VFVLVTVRLRGRHRFGRLVPLHLLHHALDYFIDARCDHFDLRRLLLVEYVKQNYNQNAQDGPNFGAVLAVAQELQGAGERCGLADSCLYLSELKGLLFRFLNDLRELLVILYGRWGGNNFLDQLRKQMLPLHHLHPHVLLGDLMALLDHVVRLVDSHAVAINPAQ
jgi:hypothetical protein